MEKELDTKSELKLIQAEILKQSIAEDKDIYAGGVYDRLENLMRFPEAVEPALDLTGEAMDKLGIYIKYTVPPITRALQQAAETRPDLSEKIFARFDDLKEMLENKDSHLYWDRYEPYKYAYYALADIAISRPELAKPALEKFKEFVKSPGNDDYTLGEAAPQLANLTRGKPELCEEAKKIYSEMLNSGKITDMTRKEVEKYLHLMNARIKGEALKKNTPNSLGNNNSRNITVHE